MPSMSEKAQNGNLDGVRSIYFEAQRLVLGAVLPFVVLGSVFARPLIQVWAGDAYEASALVMQWLLLASLGHAILYSSDLLLYASGHFRKAAIISASGGIMTLGIALLLVPRYGAAGMAFRWQSLKFYSSARCSPSKPVNMPTSPSGSLRPRCSAELKCRPQS